MNRRAFFAALLTGGSLPAQQKKQQRKFYITGLYHDQKFNDCTLPPIEAYGTDSLDALVNTGVTVWTEEAWNSFRREVAPKFRADCAARK